MHRRAYQAVFAIYIQSLYVLCAVPRGREGDAQVRVPLPRRSDSLQASANAIMRIARSQYWESIILQGFIS